MSRSLNNVKTNSNVGTIANKSSSSDGNGSVIINTERLNNEKLRKKVHDEVLVQVLSGVLSRLIRLTQKTMHLEDYKDIQIVIKTMDTVVKRRKTFVKAPTLVKSEEKNVLITDVKLKHEEVIPKDGVRLMINEKEHNQNFKVEVCLKNEEKSPRDKTKLLINEKKVSKLNNNITKEEDTVKEQEFDTTHWTDLQKEIFLKKKPQVEPYVMEKILVISGQEAIDMNLKIVDNLNPFNAHEKLKHRTKPKMKLATKVEEKIVVPLLPKPKSMSKVQEEKSESKIENKVPLIKGILVPYSSLEPIVSDSRSINSSNEVFERSIRVEEKVKKVEPLVVEPYKCVRNLFHTKYPEMCQKYKTFVPKAYSDIVEMPNHKSQLLSVMASSVNTCLVDTNGLKYSIFTMINRKEKEGSNELIDMTLKVLYQDRERIFDKLAEKKNTQKPAGVMSVFGSFFS